MARRKIREEKSKFRGTKNVLTDLNLGAHRELHYNEPIGSPVVEIIYTVLPKIGDFIVPWGDKTGTVLMVDQRTYLSPIFLQRAADVSNGASGIGCNITIVGTAGSVIRMGLYKPTNFNLNPDLLMYDLGTVSGTGLGLKQAAFPADTILPKGLYWVCLVAQGAPATAPTVSAIIGQSPCWASEGSIGSAFTVAGCRGPLTAGALTDISNPNMAGVPPHAYAGIQIGDWV